MAGKTIKILTYQVDLHDKLNGIPDKETSCTDMPNND